MLIRLMAHHSDVVAIKKNTVEMRHPTPLRSPITVEQCNFLDILMLIELPKNYI